MSVAPFSQAEDLYLVQGVVNSSCGSDIVIWRGHALFFNSGQSEAKVQLIEVSNGPEADGKPRDFVIPPQRTATLFDKIGFNGWHPVPVAGSLPPLWVVHVDAPADVILESVLYIGAGPEFHQDRPEHFGKVRLPVYTSLVPAGKPQVHLRADLGAIPSRLNVAVYNDGGVDASARIDIRQQCDDALIDTRTVTIPAKSIIQVGSFNNTPRNCGMSATLLNINRELRRAAVLQGGALL